MALSTFTLAAVAWGHFWTARGYSPGVDDSPRLWGTTRARVGPLTTVILGTSRAQAAIDPRIWAEARPGYQVLNLAIEGRSAVQTLVTLASEGGYRGLVVVDLPPFFVFDLTPWKNDVQGALAEYDQARTSPALRWDAALRRISPSAIPFRHPSLRVEPILADLVKGRLSSPPPFTTRPDRFRPLSWDYLKRPPSQDDIDFFRIFAHPATAAQRDSIIHIIATAVRTIYAHGGEVVFLRLPVCDGVRDLEEEYFPRRAYWDVARDSVPAPFLDDRDDPVLSGDTWICTDGSHLLAGQSESFTRALVPLVLHARAQTPSRSPSPVGSDLVTPSFNAVGSRARARGQNQLRLAHGML